MEEFVQWWNVNGFNVVSIILSGIISLVISAAYYHKGNRNNLQMTMLFPIVRLLNECYSKKNYDVLNELSKNYCNRYLTKSERKVLTNLISAYKNYTMTSLIFGLRTGLLNLSNTGDVDTVIPFDGKKNNHHIYLSAYKLGVLFGQDKDALVKLLQATGVSL